MSYLAVFVAFSAGCLGAELAFGDSEFYRVVDGIFVAGSVLFFHWWSNK